MTKEDDCTCRLAIHFSSGIHYECDDCGRIWIHTPNGWQLETRPRAVKAKDDDHE